MPYKLNNDILEIQWDLPREGYDFSRFDWTGKITQIRFKGVPVTTLEQKNAVNPTHFGMGLYNEFGIETALGFEEVQPGDYFHKIGIGALKKQNTPYLFSDPYDIRPARFEMELQTDKIKVQCSSENLNGYAYLLTREFILEGNRLLINYELHNSGNKPIHTEEYVHNFMGVNNEPIAKGYDLRFPFILKEETFEQLVNPESMMAFDNNKVNFHQSTKDQFFVSHLNGKTKVPAQWELLHLNSNIGIRETGDFETGKVNLWGCQHVVSPELFHSISVNPGSSSDWSRTYQFFHINDR